jgi:hypothetical protein
MDNSSSFSQLAILRRTHSGGSEPKKKDLSIQRSMPRGRTAYDEQTAHLFTRFFTAASSERSRVTTSMTRALLGPKAAGLNSGRGAATVSRPPERRSSQ